jgi:hypothetical protein
VVSCVDGVVTTDDALCVEVLRLHAEGLSIRAIAKRVGRSRMTVQRILAAAAEDDDGMVLLDARGGYRATPPFTFVGMEPVIVDLPGCDEGQLAEEPRYLDANGHSVSRLDIYRARMKLEEADQYAESAAIEADLDRQYAEAGLRRVDAIGYTRWERP